MRTLLILLLATVAVGQATDVRVKAADAVAKDCPLGKHWEKGNSVLDSLKTCKGSDCALSGPGGLSDYDYYHCVADKRAPKPKPKKSRDVWDCNGPCTASSFEPVATILPPEPMKDGDICTVHYGVCEKVKWQPPSISGYKGIDLSLSPEIVDVPAFKRELPDQPTAETCIFLSPATTRGPYEDWCNPEKAYICTDKRRIKLQSEDGAWHCLLFPKESK